MDKNKKKVQCPEYGQVFKSAQGLSGHLRLVHSKRVLTKTGVLSKPVPVLMSADSLKSLKRELSTGTQYMKKAQRLLSAGKSAEAVKEMAKATKSDYRALALFQ